MFGNGAAIGTERIQVFPKRIPRDRVLALTVFSAAALGAAAISTAVLLIGSTTFRPAIAAALVFVLSRACNTFILLPMPRFFLRGIYTFLPRVAGRIFFIDS